MSLSNCPECGHEVSIDAVACPNCGRPLAAPTPVIQRKVVVAERPTDEGFPKWVIVPIVILALVVVFLLIAITRNNEENANTRTVNVNLATQRRSTDSTTTRTDNPPNQVEVPSSSTTVNPPSSTTTAPSYPSSSTSVPSSQTEVSVPADRGIVVIDAKVSTKTGAVQAVKNEKFYLLDKDLDSVLNDAKLEPIDGNSLSDSFGLAVLYPDRYGDFRRDALKAIEKHIKYNATTDGGGKASMKDVKPDSYYLFGITKTRNGFAIWSSPVSIIGGENKLNLQPARLNEMSE